MANTGIYLLDPAHPEPPERALPPSAWRPLVHSLLLPDGGDDVIPRLGQLVAGPGRHRKT